MSQHDFTIANQTASSARSDINSALQALVSNNSGADAPTTTYANMWWYETDTNLLKIRNEGDSAWINVAYVNQSTNKFEILDDTKVVTTSGTQVGILGDQATATWETGTGTTESLVSPFKIASAIDALAFQSVNLSAQGKVKLGFGLEVIWGYFTSTSDQNQTHNFHTAFTNNCWGMAMGGVKTAGTEGFQGHTYCAVQVLSKTQFQSNRPDSIQGSNVQFFYIAWGN
jgi:hypothetical protein